MIGLRTECEITRAIQRRDAEALHRAIESAHPLDQDFDEIARVIEDAGGWRYVNWDRIRLDDPMDGTTTVRREWCGHARSEHDPGPRGYRW